MAKKAKYPSDDYIDYDIPSDDMESDIRNYRSKLVKTRKYHFCCYCGTTIHSGDEALYFTAITDDGFCNGYYCLYCIEDYMDAGKDVISPDELVHRYSERVDNGVFK